MNQPLVRIISPVKAFNDESYQIVYYCELELFIPRTPNTNYINSQYIKNVDLLDEDLNNTWGNWAFYKGCSYRFRYVDFIANSLEELKTLIQKTLFDINITLNTNFQIVDLELNNSILLCANQP